MASPQTPDASEIRRRGRQRLIGAVAIALLLIVFVPMLLDSEPRSTREEPKIDIPAKEKAPPLPEPKPESRPVPKAAPVEAPKPPPVAEVKPVEPKEQVVQAPKGGFAIQVGAFRDDAKLAQTREKLTAAGIKTYTEPSGEFKRLRVGPFPTREAAEKNVAAVRLTIPDAKIVPVQ